MDKPEKYGIMEYYAGKLKELCKFIKKEFLGYWYCVHCDDYHSNRTKIFTLLRGDVCSLGKEAPNEFIKGLKAFCEVLNGK